MSTLAGRWTPVIAIGANTVAQIRQRPAIRVLPATRASDHPEMTTPGSARV